MFKQENDRGDREFRPQGADEIVVDDWGADMLESTGNSLQDLDGVLSRFTLAMAAV